MDSDCSYETKRCLLLGRKAVTNLDSLLKSRDITLPRKVKAIFFPLVMHRWTWVMKKAEHQRIDAFKLWCWRRLLRTPWIAKISKQSVLKEPNPEYSLEGLMLKLKLHYFGHLIWRDPEKPGKDPDAGKNWRRKVKGAAEDEIIRYHHWLNGREFEQILGDSGGQRSLVCYSPLGSQKSDMTQWLNNNSYHCNHCSDHIHPRDWDL